MGSSKGQLQVTSSYHSAITSITIHRKTHSKLPHVKNGFILRQTSFYVECNAGIPQLAHRTDWQSLVVNTYLTELISYYIKLLDSKTVKWFYSLQLKDGGLLCVIITQGHCTVCINTVLITHYNLFCHYISVDNYTKQKRKRIKVQDNFYKVISLV